MKKKYKGNGRKKITVTIDKELNDKLEKYIEENEIYNKSSLIEQFIKKQINEEKKDN